MKTARFWIAAAAATSVLTLAGCASGPNQRLGIGAGAVGGALVGNAIGGNAASTIGGAAVGGLIGNEVGRRSDERNYYDNNQGYPQRGYYQNEEPRRGYYPNNGPRY